MQLRIAGLTSALIVLAIPAVASAQSCERLYSEYRHADGPKAYAVGTDGGCGYASARSASNLYEAHRRAIDYCRQNAHGCHVVEEQRD